MSIVFLAAFFVVLTCLVEIATIALKITGMEIQSARFQALSALVTVGFTTAESELVTRHPARRRIIMALMVLGYIGTATIVSSLINVLGHPVTLLQVGFSLLMVIVPVSIVSNRWLLSKLDHGIERRLARQKMLERRSIEEVLHLGPDYGVAEVKLTQGHPLADQTIVESKLRDRGIFILAIERGYEFIHSPRGSMELRTGDKLVVYGNLAGIYGINYPDRCCR